MNIHRVLPIALLILTCPAISAAQEEHQHHHEAGEKIGKVNFQTSCAPSVRNQFNRAVAWLHSFEYAEAELAFNDVARADPSCGMAHWGVAMSQYHQLWAPPTRAELEKGSEAVSRARLAGAGSERERGYIEAIGAFYKDFDKLDHQTRARAYEQAMEQVYRSNPRDNEAAVFYALALNASALAASPMDKTYAKQKKAGEILNRVLQDEPEHPGVTHYLIHSYDYPQLAQLAVEAARRYAKLAPSSAHALHMPSHIFTRLGLWQEDIDTNIASEAAARDFARRNNLKGVWDEQLHAMDYLEYAYLQTGRDHEARAVLDELRAIKKTDPEDFKCAYSFAAVPARWVLERRKWADAAELKIEPADFPWERFQWAEAITHFARAIGAARTGNIKQARIDVEKLTDLQRALVGARDNYDWATQVEIQRRAATAWLSKSDGKIDEALQLMRSAADLEDSTDKHPVTPGSVVPARELLGDMLLELNKPREALKEFERSLADSPNRFNGLLGAARSAETAGDSSKAKAFYQKLVVLCTNADGDRPELQKAKAYLAGRSSTSRQAK